MKAHSPGPWKWVRDGLSGVRRLVSATGRAVFWPVPDLDRELGVLRSTDVNCPSDSDARLIAAAPELLIMLDALLNHTSGADCCCTPTEKAAGDCAAVNARALIARMLDGGRIDV